MAEYIDREALIRYVEKQEVIIKDELSIADAMRIQGNVFRRAVETCPAADVVDARHGEWDWYPDRMDRQELVCTNCEEPAPYNEDGERIRTPYCPNCGAKMNGKGEE